MTGLPSATRDALERLDALAAERGVELRTDVPLAPLTTLRVGGAADRLVDVRDRDQLLAALRLAAEQSRSDINAMMRMMRDYQRERGQHILETIGGRIQPNII